MRITLLTGKTFDIEEALGFNIKVIKSSSSRRITLRIDSKERIPVLSLPRFCSAKKAVEFVKAHKDWIDENLSKIPQAIPFSDNSTISLFGHKLTIKHNPALRSGVYIDGSILYVSGDINFLNRRVRDFIKAQAQKEFLKLSRKKAKEIGCKINDVCIKDTKSRWGSCSSMNNINYNWRVALAPAFVIDYLISHEVAHLMHQDHSENFWSCVKTLCPDYIKGRNWLKTNGKELYLYEGA